VRQQLREAIKRLRAGELTIAKMLRTDVADRGRRRRRYVTEYTEVVSLLSSFRRCSPR